jgi:hypothetical protein
MTLLQQALRGARHTPKSHRAQRCAIVIGGAGTLGAAVLELALGSGVFDRVQVLLDAPMAPAMRGFEALSRSMLDSGMPLQADSALIVFDRERRVFGREDAFHRPQPEALPALAGALRRAGVLRLIVVLPHAPALLPAALKQGLASLDEHAVAGLGFEHLVIVRSAQPAGRGQAGHSPLQRLAHTLLAQLHWMLPQREQPVRPAKVAAFVLQLARALPQARPGTRVVPPELVWMAAQGGDVAALAQAWLAGETLPVIATPRQRW